MSRQPSFRDLKDLSAFLDGELSASATRRMKSRLARDPNLLAALDDLRGTRAVLRRTPQRRAPRNFTLSPQTVAQRPPMPSLVPVMNYASMAAALLLFFSFVSGFGSGGSKLSAPEPAMMEAMEAPAESYLNNLDEDAIPAEPLAEAPLAPAPAMEAPVEEPAAEESAAEAEAGNAASDRAVATEMVEAELAEGELTATEKALTPTLIPTPSPTSVPPVPIVKVKQEPVPLLSFWQRILLIAIVLFALISFALRRKEISKWQKTSR